MAPEVVTGPDGFVAAAKAAPPEARVPIEVRVSVDDPFLAYRRARKGTPGRSAGASAGAYLATTGGQSGWGYFGVDPLDVTAIDPGGESLAELSALLSGETLHRGACDVPYPCGVIGWLSYDLARELETLPAGTDRDRDLPRIQLARYDRLAAWEEPRDPDASVTLRITACPRLSEDPRRPDISAAYERGRERALGLAQECLTGDPGIGTPPVATETAQFESDCSREAFTERVRQIKTAIRDGETFQANVSQRLRAPAAVHPISAFEALRTVNPAPYSALLEFPGIDLVSASPELLLHREGDRLVTEPIAGTRPRGKTPAEDQQLEAALRSDEKERAEHAMLVDLERNDLGRVSAFGSVDVTEYRRVDRYAEVMHLVSKVEGRLRPDCDLVDAIAAAFPGGTITGAPKPRTMELIDETERTRRGPYTGSIGIFGFDDRATLNIIIRTLVRYGDEYHLRVGAGIVHDSEPDREYAETLDKGRALVTAVDDALGERADMRLEHR